MDKINEFINFCNEMEIPKRDTTIIGEFFIDDCIVLEEKLVGNFSIGNNVKSQGRSENMIKVEVYGKERTVPHFHVYNKKGTINACFKLCTNSTFNHSDYHNKLPKQNSDFSDKLDKFMRSKRCDESDLTNWEYAILLWNTNNPNFTIPENEIPDKIPDYVNMKWDE